MAGSTGVLIPPQGYLERLRALCDKYGILLIFDEVITGFGRLGAPFAADRFGIRPDIISMAKGLTNAAVPMGAVAVRNEIYQAVIETAPPGTIELFHGYTYSGHPLAAAAAIAAISIHQRERLHERARAMESYFEEAVHSLKGLPHVIDIRNLGLVAGIELAPRPGKPTERAVRVFHRCFDAGLLIRTTGDIIALSPPLIVERAHIDRMIETLALAIRAEADG
jgi:beta-alanine--pyruvate transaminase